MISTGHEAGLEAFAHEVFLGEGAAVRRLRLQVSRIAPHFRATLLTGERGVGKRTVARELHRLSPASAVKFAEIPTGDVADGAEVPAGCGTIYMEGLEELSNASQERLLKRLGGIDRRIRLVLASDADLRGMLASGRLRQDLYEAVGMPAIWVAPLRERMGDFDELAASILRRVGGGASFALSALMVMRSYAWPGNYEELWAVCAQVARPGAVIEAEDLPGLGERRVQEILRLDEVIERHVKDVLEKCGGNKLKAAELLGISRSTLYRMLEAA